MCGCTGAAAAPALRERLSARARGELPLPDTIPARELSGGGFFLLPGNLRALRVSLANLKNSAYTLIS